MERKITIAASDGEVFTGTNYQELEKEVNNYELELSKKRQELIEKQRKVEAEKKAKEQTKKVLMKELDTLAAELTKKKNEYQKATGELLGFVTVNGELQIRNYGDIKFTPSYRFLGNYFM